MQESKDLSGRVMHMLDSSKGRRCFGSGSLLLRGSSDERVQCKPMPCGVERECCKQMRIRKKSGYGD